MSILNVARSQHFDLEACDVERAIGDMLGAGGRLGARVLGAENAIGFAAVTSPLTAVQACRAPSALRTL